MPGSASSANVSGRRRGVLLAAGGVLILSLDSLLVRLAASSGGTVLFWRGALMALTLTAVVVARDGVRGLAGLRSPVTWAVALSFTAGTAAFVLSILLTRVANTVVIISAAPLFAALFSLWFLHERVPPRTWLAIFFACCGVLLVAYASLGEGGLAGDILALLNAICTGASMTLLRRHPEASRSLILALSGVLLALAALPFAGLPSDPAGMAALGAMGLVQIPLSLVMITAATRYLPAAEVSLFLLLETVFAPLWVWCVLGETVPAATLAGGILMLGTLTLHALHPAETQPESPRQV